MVTAESFRTKGKTRFARENLLVENRLKYIHKTNYVNALRTCFCRTFKNSSEYRCKQNLVRLVQHFDWDYTIPDYFSYRINFHSDYYNLNCYRALPGQCFSVNTIQIDEILYINIALSEATVSLVFVRNSKWN